jgi:hypothetical protein
LTRKDPALQKAQHAIAKDGLERLKPVNYNRTNIADLLMEIGHTINDACDAA